LSIGHPDGWESEKTWKELNYIVELLGLACQMLCCVRSVDGRSSRIMRRRGEEEAEERRKKKITQA
jgi:hypothetical protein